MSRCFPYPPPGYTLSRASNEALIESIKLQKEKEKTVKLQKEKEKTVKLQKEKEKTKSDRKREKKRDKDEKKKSKEEKAKLKTTLAHESCGGKSCGDFKSGFLQKERKDESEQLERSSITEEHGVPQNPSYSSDSTENSNKRKRHSSTNASPNGTHVQGNILRIRLPSRKHIQINKTPTEQQPCSTSGRIDIPDSIAWRAEPDKTCSTSGATGSTGQALPPCQPDNGLIVSCPSHLLTSGKDDQHGREHVSKRQKKIRKAAKKYADLIENWVPPSQDLHLPDVDVEDWLFGGKKPQTQMPSDKKDQSLNQMPCSTSASLWPAAQYLPGADIYALPFTIPF